jgi:hypothetical protein
VELYRVILILLNLIEYVPVSGMTKMHFVNLGDWKESKDIGGESGGKSNSNWAIGRCPWTSTSDYQTG